MCLQLCWDRELDRASHGGLWMRVLVVEDEAALADVIARGLRQAGFAVDIAVDGEEALAKGKYRSTMSSSSIAVSRHPRRRCLPRLAAQQSDPRIIMLTAAGNVDARIAGLAIGADDYLPKPFVMAELIARIRALGRRPERRDSAGTHDRRSRA